MGSSSISFQQAVSRGRSRKKEAETGPLMGFLHCQTLEAGFRRDARSDSELAGRTLGSGFVLGQRIVSSQLELGLCPKQPYPSA